MLILVLLPRDRGSVELEELNPLDAGMAAAAFASGLGDAPFGHELLAFDGPAAADVPEDPSPPG